MNVNCWNCIVFYGKINKIKICRSGDKIDFLTSTYKQL